MEIHEGLTGTLSNVKILQEMTREWSGANYTKPNEGWESRSIIISEHAGTHVDAPYHFIPKTKTIEQLPLEKFIGEAVILDIRGRKKTSEPISEENLISVCSRDNVEIKENDIVLILAEQESTGLSDQAVDWLIKKKINGIGTNFFIEGNLTKEGQQKTYAHISFLTKNTVIFEGLINLEEIDEKRFLFIGLPLKIKEGTGSPIRAVAVL
jgi:kynurenine formamidase